MVGHPSYFSPCYTTADNNTVPLRDNRERERDDRLLDLNQYVNYVFYRFV